MGASLLALVKSIYYENDYCFFHFHFQKTGFALGLVLKASVSETRKLPIASGDFQTKSLFSGYRSSCVLIKKKTLAKNDT